MSLVVGEDAPQPWGKSQEGSSQVTVGTESVRGAGTVLLDRRVSVDSGVKGWVSKIKTVWLLS